MINIQFENVLISLLSTYFFILIIKKNKKLENFLSKALLKFKVLTLTYVVPIFIVIFLCNFIISCLDKYGLYIIQFFSLLGVLEIVLHSYKSIELKKEFDLSALKESMETLKFSTSFITKNYLTESKNTIIKYERLNSNLEKVEIKLNNIILDFTTVIDELRKNILEITKNQNSTHSSLVVLQGEIKSVDLKLKDNLLELKDDYSKDFSDLNQDVNLLNEAILELKSVLTAKENTKAKVEEPEMYMDPYLKAYLEG